MYHVCAGATPAACHSANSFTFVPEESPRDTNGLPARAIRRNASAAVAARATCAGSVAGPTMANRLATDRKSTRLNSSHGYISYAVFCLKKKKKKTNVRHTITHQC